MGFRALGFRVGVFECQGVGLRGQNLWVCEFRVHGDGVIGFRVHGVGVSKVRRGWGVKGSEGLGC